MLSLNTAKSFALTITLSCTLAIMAVFAAAQGASAQAVRAECDGNPRTLTTLHDFPARTGDVFTNVQDDSMAQLEIRDATDVRVAIVTLRVNQTYTVPSSANGGKVWANDSRALATTPRVKCGAAATPSTTATSTATPTAAAQTSVTVQASVTQSAINTNVAGRFGGTGISANPNGLTVSTRGLDKAASDLGEPELNAWVGIEGRRFTGTTTGDSRNLSFGIDRLITPNTVIGGYVSYNDQTATVGGATTTTRSPLFGAYAARKLNNGLFFSGFVGYGRPQYSTATDSFAATRTVVGLSMSGQFEAGSVRLTPLAGLLANREDLPAFGTNAADRLENVQANLSVRVEPAQRFANGLLPYATIGAEYRRQGSSLVAYDSFTKPRLGLGFDWKMAAGSLRLDVDYGSITSTANDMGASLIYDFKF